MSAERKKEIRYEKQSDGSYRQFEDGKKGGIYTEDQALADIATRNKESTNPDVPPMKEDTFAGSAVEHKGNYDPGAVGVDGILLISNDGQTETFLPANEILEDYNSDEGWSVNIPIDSLAWDTDGTIEYGADGTALYDDTGTSQTVARIPIYRSGHFVATFGVYQEGLRVVGGEAVVEFYKL